MITWSDLVLPPINLWSLPSQTLLKQDKKMSTEEGNTDLAAMQEELARDKAINIIRKKASAIDTSNPTGLCWTCGEYVGYSRRWCDSQCRDNDET